MNNIDEQSDFVRRIGGRVTDMSDRLEGKEKKRFLYKKINTMSLDGEDLIEDLMTLRYIAKSRMDDQADVLKRKLAEHEINLLKLICDGLGERIVYNERLIETVQDTLIPYYHGRFRVEQSREISFLPLELRLFIYGQLLKKEASPVTRYHLLNRISMTLYKSGEESLGEYSLFLQCMLGEELSPLLFGNKDFETLFSYEIKANQKVRILRKDILAAAELTPEIAGREFWYGFKGFSDLRNVNDIDAAKICLSLFTLYFEKNFAIAETVGAHILKYYMTKNPNVIKKLLQEERLNEFTIRSKYVAGTIGASEGPSEMNNKEIKRYEDNIKRKVESKTVSHQSKSMVGRKYSKLD